MGPHPSLNKVILWGSVMTMVGWNFAGTRKMMRVPSDPMAATSIMMKSITLDDESDRQQHRQVVTAISTEIQSSQKRKRRRKIILLGPHDRYNFGDLLFEKVVSKLLIERAGYLENELISTGIVTTDMSKYGGNPNISDVKTVVEWSRSSHDGPFNIIYLGGEAMGCTVECGSRMMPDAATRQRVLRRSIYQSQDCAYLFPKKLLIANQTTITTTMRKSGTTTSHHHQQRIHPPPVAIVNSVGGQRNAGKEGCIKAVETSDYLGMRDTMPGEPFKWVGKTRQVSLPSFSRPDSAVMTHSLFSDVVDDFGSQGEVNMIRTTTNNRYLAVQFKNASIDEENYAKVAHTFDLLHNKTNLETVFFMAGSVPGHDSAEMYQQIGSFMTTPYRVFETEHVWSVISLIRFASAVISTSLHVRIMAFVFARPRVLVNTAWKHTRFVEIWESHDAKDSLLATEELWQPRLLPQRLIKQIATSPTNTYLARSIAVNMYLEGFDEYASLLEQTWNGTSTEEEATIM